MKYIFALLLPMLLLSCAKEDNDWRSEIYLDESNEEVRFDELFSVDRRISLEDHPDAYFHDFSTVKWIGDRLYVYDFMSKDKNIIVFDLDGNYLGRIGKFGQGPEEYPNLLDFTVDGRNDNVIILGPDSQIFIYNREGEFLGKRKISDARLLHIERIKGGFLASTSVDKAIGNDSTHLFYRFDDDFNLVAAKFKPDMQDNFIINNASQISIVNGNGLIFNNYPGVAYLYDCKEDTAGYHYHFRLPNQLKWEHQDFLEFENALMTHCWTKDCQTNSQIALISFIGSDHKEHTAALIDKDKSLRNVIDKPSRLITTNDHFISLEEPADDSNIDIVILKVK